MDQVLRLELLVREGGSGKSGFLVGAAAGTAVVYNAAQALAEGDSDKPAVLLISVALGSILGGPAGALIGNSIDPPAIRWVPLWR